MDNKEGLTKVQFWCSREFRNEIIDFAHSYNLSASDLYKAGAMLIKKLLENPMKVELNLFTRTFKDMENSQVRKQILKDIATNGSSKPKC